MGFARGILVQVLNPKIIVFGLTLFSTMLTPITDNLILDRRGSGAAGGDRFLRDLGLGAVWLVSEALSASAARGADRERRAGAVPSLQRGGGRRNHLIKLSGASRAMPLRTSSLHRHALGEVARLIHVRAAQHGDVIRQQLQRDHRQNRRQQRRRVGDVHHLVRFRRDEAVAFGREGDHDGVARLRLLDLADHLVVERVLERNRQHRHVLVDQRNRTVLHLARRVALGVNVADLLELERAFERNRVVDAAPQIQEVRVVIDFAAPAFRPPACWSSTCPTRSGRRARSCDVAAALASLSVPRS